MITYDEAREWELKEGECWLDYFGNEEHFERTVEILEDRYPEENWREEEEYGVMGLYMIKDVEEVDEDWEDFVLRAYVEAAL